MGETRRELTPRGRGPLDEATIPAHCCVAIATVYARRAMGSRRTPYATWNGCYAIPGEYFGLAPDH